MEALTAKDIESAIEAMFDSDTDTDPHIGSWYDLKWELRHFQPWKVEGLEHPVLVVEDFGGGEGSGEEMWIIVSYDGRYFRKDGYYASFDGDNWDGPFVEVRRSQEIVTVFREVGK